ncbi:hypothetical protein FQN54_004341 [Arachnomyces sp. PD_36]|nr:hypothetical protein FQN54_004341 [Arachnomyces sp. PD_36]
MVEAHYFDDPSLLQESESPIQQATLVLLQPLANADMLGACRNPDSRLVPGPDGVMRRTSIFEYLNIQHLSKAWRQALMKVPPIPYLTFDLALPKERGEKSEGSFQKVYWDTGVPERGGLCILTREVMTLANTIATGIRMRADGEVRFEVTYVESELVSPGGMKTLKGQLLGVAKAGGPRAKRGGAGPYESQEPALDGAGINASKDAMVEVRELKRETVVGETDDDRLKCATATREQPPDEKEDKPTPVANSIYHAETKPQKLCDTRQATPACI